MNSTNVDSVKATERLTRIIAMKKADELNISVTDVLNLIRECNQ